MKLDQFKAVYGTFDKQMLPVSIIEVTEKCILYFLSRNTIKIPANTNFNSIFGDPAADQIKFLQINYRGRKYNITEDHYKEDIIIKITKIRKRLKVVYYAYVDRNTNWREIIEGQLAQIKRYGILDEADLYVHITDVTNYFDDVVTIIKNIWQDVKISVSDENQFEYPAIKLIHELSKKDPDSIYIYFHTKGMSYHGNARDLKEITLLTFTFQNWRKNLEAFHNAKIQKIGLFPARENFESKLQAGLRGAWIWYNFWYAKGSYIAKCEDPELQDKDRWYFEHWLGGTQDESTITNDDCYSLHHRGISYFTCMENLQGLKTLMGKLQEV